MNWYESGLSDHEFSLKIGNNNNTFLIRLFTHADEIFKDKGGAEFVYKVLLTRNILTFFRDMNNAINVATDDFDENIGIFIKNRDIITKHNKYLKASGEINRKYPVKGIPKKETGLPNDRFIPIMNIKASRNHSKWNNK